MHEVCAHATLPLVAAATALGLAISRDAGASWSLLDPGANGAEVSDSLAVAVLEEQVLFSVQDGPFAARSQLWRWQIGTDHVEPVRAGLPAWLEGKLDTAHVATDRGGRTALVDGGGTLWLSETGSRGWRVLARNLGPVSAVLLT